jgi:hypothetical protein
MHRPVFASYGAFCTKRVPNIHGPHYNICYIEIPELLCLTSDNHSVYSVQSEAAERSID